MKANYRNLLALSLIVFFGTAVQAQLYTPGGSLQGNTGSNSVGIGHANPDAKLDVMSLSDDVLLLKARSSYQGSSNPLIPISPEYALRIMLEMTEQGMSGSGIYRNHFTVTPGGKTHIGYFPTEKPDLLSVRGSIGSYQSDDTFIRMRYGSGSQPILSWNSFTNNNMKIVCDNTGLTALTVTPQGQLSVGFDDGMEDHKLFVNGTGYFRGDPNIYQHSIYVEGSAVAEELFILPKSVWGDFVFEPEYPLLPLSELDAYLIKHKHLPEFPSAAAIAETGIPVGEIQRLLTMKVEELTLYLLQMNEEMQALREEITTLRGEK